MTTLIDLMCINLDTRDKRYMFLKILFPASLSNIDLEGSPKKACTNICDYFRKNDKLDELGEVYQKHFN